MALIKSILSMQNINMNNINSVLLRRLDLNNLVVLHSLLTTRSVSLSADQLCLGQPAVSHILKRLREILADELLCRYGREMVLTPLAESLRQPLADWLAQGQALLCPEQPFDALAYQGQYRLAMPDLLEAALLPDLAAALRDSLPGLVLEVLAMRSGDVPAALETGRIDSAVGYFPECPDKLARQHLYNSAYVGFYHPGKVSLPDMAHPSRLAGLPRIGHSYAGESLRKIDQWLAEQGMTAPVIVSTSSLLALPSLLERLGAIAILPHAIAPALRRFDARLAVARLHGEPPDITIEQLWHPRQNADPVHQRVSSTLQKVIMAMPQH